MSELREGGRGRVTLNSIKINRDRKGNKNTNIEFDIKINYCVGMYTTPHSFYTILSNKPKVFSSVIKVFCHLLSAQFFFNFFYLLLFIYIVIELKWEEPKEEELRKFLVERMGFNPDRVTTGIAKLQTAHRKKSQKRMDRYEYIL